jgi:hypothetical protein
MDGLVLSTPFAPSSLKHDKSIDEFNMSAIQSQPDKKDLDSSKSEFQEQLLMDLFSFSQLQSEINWYLRVLSESRKSLSITDLSSVEWIKPQVKTDITDVSEKFRKQLKRFLVENSNAEKSIPLQERIVKAASYFSDKIQQLVIEPVNELSTETDNKEVKRSITKAEEKLIFEAALKKESLLACKDGFIVKDYLIEKAKAAMEPPARKRARKSSKLPVSHEISNPELYELIKKWRNAKSSELGLSVFMVLPLKTMRALSNQVPGNMEELKEVHGFGKLKLERFGHEILELIHSYREEHEVVIAPVIQKKSLNAIPKKNTKLVSLELWNNHKDLNKVAEERGLVRSTIEGHLAHFVEKGELPVSDFIEEEDLKKVTAFLVENQDMPFSEIKTKLGDDFTYGDLRFVRAHLNHQQTIQRS